MQVPFLDADHFHSALHLPIDVPTFLHLPVPQPRPIFVSNSADHFQFYPDGESFAEIEKFPINDPLSKFRSEVLPRKFDPESVYFGCTGHHDSEGFAGAQRLVSSGLVDDIDGGDSASLQEDEIEECKSAIARTAPEDDDDNNVDGKDSSWIGIPMPQFEEPEMHLSDPKMRLSNECVCLDDKRAQIFFAVSEVENSLESSSPRLQMRSPKEIQESLFQLEHIAYDFGMEEKARALHETGSAGKKANACHLHTFPLFEEDEIGTGIFPCSAHVEENFQFYLGGIGINPLCHEEDSLSAFGQELAGSLHPDAFEFLSNYCISLPCAQPESSFRDSSPGVDLVVDMVDAPILGKHNTATSPVVFQEHEFLLTDRSHLHEQFFRLQVPNEEDDDSLGWALMEDANFKSLNELIVTREITPTDGLFKSLPVPIACGLGNLAPISKRIDDVFAKLQSLPFSASDRIYLDWYLLEREKCDSLISTLCRDVLASAPDVPIVPLGDENEKMFFRLVFHGDAPGVPPNTELEEPLNVLSISSRDGDQSASIIGLSSSLNGVHVHEPVKNELSADESAKKKKAKAFSKTVPYLSDLDFFLNPMKTLAREKCERAAIDHASFPEEGELGSAFASSENGSPLKPELQALVNIGDSYHIRSGEGDDNVGGCCIPATVSSTSKEANAEQKQRKTIIVVNTRNSDKEMIASRRSTYQKILAVEKEEDGTEVVERDLHQPVDIVISCGACLVWYDCRNILKKATSADEASSSLPSCIEDLAATVLALLSFTFQACILVFEGDTSFLSIVMDSSDGLCAAAASLGIDLQLFCSYSQELTDEIILSCILQSTKVKKKMHLKMAESETLAESVLTKFPSVSPLTAHAILCSVTRLIEFFEWSHDRRILAIQRYQIPDEIIALFSTVCSYGEREDAKSMTTDCSSSISSGRDSIKLFHFNADKLPVPNLQKRDQHADDYVGEVIDFTDFSFMDTISPKDEEANCLRAAMEHDRREKGKAARRLSFGKSIRPIASKKMVPSNQQKLLEEVLMHGPGRAEGLLMKEEMPPRRRTATPLSRAIGSGHPPPGSPWTIEFLNRIRDSRRKRQQSLLPSHASGDASEQKTPSAIDLFRHRGGCSAEKLRGREQQRRSSSSSAGDDKTIFHPPQAWTPIDKRSTQTLSFRMDDDARHRQTRLVWSDGDARRSSKKFRYQ